ncbi:response regulator transcription factor [Candidatus Sumerlaeota bacterium]|nr:response regulator transcription factor [Candidatus Sumerlaeota bacterium]
MKILIAEDDRNIRKGLVEILEDEGYDTLEASDGKEALDLFKSQSPDFICLDIMMPGMNGYDVCREMRKRHSNIPIIFISAKSEEIDRVLGLELGADDFIMKPFGIREVVARIRAVTRRYLSTSIKKDVFIPFKMGDLEIFPAELQAKRGNYTIDLSLRDIHILITLYKNKGKPVDRHTLFQEAWGVDHIPNSRTLDQHVSQLRKRIEEDPHNPVIISTVHGVGYRFL